MLAIEYYRKLKNIYPNEVHKCKYIYIYTNDGVVENVLFKFRKNKGKNGCLFIDEVVYRWRSGGGWHLTPSRPPIDI